MKELQLHGALAERYNRRTAIIDDCMYKTLAVHKWYLRKMGGNTFYAAANIGGKIKNLHSLITPPAIGYDVDHKNGNGLDCRECNLRYVDRCANLLNVRLPNRRPTGASLPRGVSIRSGEKHKNKIYRATIGLMTIGSYQTVEEASAAWEYVSRRYIEEHTYTHIEVLSGYKNPRNLRYYIREYQDLCQLSRLTKNKYE